MISWNLVDNTGVFQDAYEEEIDNAWEEIGLLAEGFAQGYCSVDTGRLRNSINHATILGQGEDSYTDNDGNAFTGRAAKVLPDHGECYIGTNVDYAVYQEFGTSKISAANHGNGFLRPAITDHMDKYKSVMAQRLGFFGHLSQR